MESLTLRKTHRPDSLVVIYFNLIQIYYPLNNPLETKIRPNSIIIHNSTTL